MFFKQWQILVVDDEPDMLSISRLAMKNYEVYGLPVKILTAASKAAAIEFFETKPTLMPTIAVAFIDVVMETDEAGLELCQYIREELNNKATQIFVRTGQPGIAPERKVIDRYDINGYFAKVEMTENKLYSLTKSGVRQFLWNWQAMAVLLSINALMTNAGSREHLQTTFRKVISDLAGKPTGAGVHEAIQQELYLGGTGLCIDSQNMDADTARTLKQQLEQREGLSLDLQGDKYVRTEDNLHLITIAPDANRVNPFLLFRTAFDFPENIITMLYSVLKTFAILWTQAK